jgi:rod shape-determining protein MreC
LPERRKTVRGFFRSFKFKVFVVIALVLIGLMIRTGLSGGFASFTADGVGLIFSPFQKLSASVAGFFSGIVDNIETFSTLKSENGQLKKEISSMQSKIVNYDDMLRENQQLEAAYDLHKSNPDFKLKPAEVISGNTGQWFSSFTIDVGQLDGVGYMDAVITSDSDLVGKVTKIYAHSAVVTTILDPSLQAGVLVSETGDPGQSQGDLGLLAKGEFKVMYLTKDSAVSPGDIIVTSGTGGVFPRNLKVGTVDSVTTDQTGMSLYTVCRPMVSPTSIKNVFVLTDFNGKEDLTVSKGGGS